MAVGETSIHSLLGLSDRVDRSLRFYLNATTREVLEISLKSIAQAKKLEDSVDAAVTFLCGITEKFFVFIDELNYDDLDLHPYLPRTKWAHILIATQLRSAKQRYHVSPDGFISIGPLLPDDALSLLLATAGVSWSTGGVKPR